MRINTMPVTDRDVALYCIYLDFMGLRKCLSRLRTTGVRGSNVTVLFPEGTLLMLSSEGTLLKRLSNESGRQRKGDVRSNDPTGVLLSLGISMYDAAGYANWIRNGGILLSVRP